MGGFCWLGDCEVTVDELLGGKKDDKPASQLDMAKSFIAGLMTNSEIAANEVFRRGADIGLPQVTLKQAKSELGIKSVKRGSEWFWTSESAQGYQEAHTDGVIPLNPLPEVNNGDNLD